ncbi:hypothetical protein NYR97_12725 [Xanthomonas hydrangeae]|uniref:Uncharacterized protein n=1 Tax=Xanthomonas hydrangeae TaxID=2775159 RepID=A0AAU0B9W3_9XANT|nr:hypothetical protein [Xanthomonas hydrangeae]WOB48143.1 hypothetical protein NYR97_12725 [Xanthomonas hydrangeae]
MVAIDGIAMCAIVALDRLPVVRIVHYAAWRAALIDGDIFAIFHFLFFGCADRISLIAVHALRCRYVASQHAWTSKKTRST